MSPNGSHSYELASIGQRAFARSIDFLVMAMISAAILVPSAQRTAEDEITTPSWAIVVTLLLWLLYETVMVAAIGQTVGKMATVCRVVDRNDGTKPSVVQAALRSLVLVALVRIFGAYGLIILVTAAIDPITRRGALDRVAGTVVVHARPELPAQAPDGLANPPL